MNSRFALIDVNNFHVSCERAFNPNLENQPLVVLSNNEGCTVARSNEVKARGVKMATPWFQLKDLAKNHHIVALSSNYTLYGDMADRVMTILRDFSPDVEGCTPVWFYQRWWRQLVQPDTEYAVTWRPGVGQDP